MLLILAGCKNWAGCKDGLSSFEHERENLSGPVASCPLCMPDPLRARRDT